MCHLKYFYFEIKGTKVRLQTKDSKTGISYLRLSGEWEFKGGVVESADSMYANEVPFARITYTLHLKVLDSFKVVKCVDSIMFDKYLYKKGYYYILFKK